MMSVEEGMEDTFDIDELIDNIKNKLDEIRDKTVERKQIDRFKSTRELEHLQIELKEELINKINNIKCCILIECFNFSELVFLKEQIDFIFSNLEVKP